MDQASAERDAAFFRTTIDELLRRDLKFQKAISVGTNSTTATRYRIEAARRALVERIPAVDVAIEDSFAQELDSTEGNEAEEEEEES